MRYLPTVLCAALLALPVRAAEQPPAAETAAERLGYAFEYPRVLAQQRLFGLAHGVALLAAACMDVPESAEAAQLAYGAWRQRQQGAIDTATAELSAYYRPVGNVDTEWQDVAKFMHLRDALPYEAASPELQAACATLPEALARPRYDLAQHEAADGALAVGCGHFGFPAAAAGGIRKTLRRAVSGCFRVAEKRWQSRREPPTRVAATASASQSA